MPKIGVIIIIFIMYRFLIMERISYLLDEFVPSRFLLIGFLFFILQLFSFIMIIKLLLKKQKESLLALYVAKLINQIYYTPIKKVGIYLLKKQLIKNQVHLFCEVLCITINTKSRVYLLIITFMVIPKIELALCLAGDVFLLKKISLFYEMLWILLMPMTFQALVSMAQVYTSAEKTLLETLQLDIKREKTKQTLESKKPVTPKDFEMLCTNWEFFLQSLDIINAIRLCQKTRIYLLCSLVPVSLFLSCWSYYCYTLCSFKRYPYIMDSNLLEMLFRFIIGL